MNGINAIKRFTPRKTLAALAVGSVLLLSAPAMAADSSVIKGQVTSSEGSNLSNATVTLKHKTKGLVYTVETNNNGAYTLRNIPVGDYDVSIAKDGYGTTKGSSVRISIGQAVILDGELFSEQLDNVERIAVTGSMIRRIDTASSTSGMVFNQDDLNLMPVNNGFESMALLAPGTAAPGADSFNGASSFGGSSSAENAYFLNGLNITNLKTGLGSLALPWEAIAQTEIKTGAITPDFGGAIGGVVNSVSRSGDNEFHFGGEVRWDPSSMRATQDPIYNAAGTMVDVTTRDSQDFKQAKIWASGAIVEDSLFYYGLYEPRVEEDIWSGQTTTSERKRTADRWFVKLDWFISEDHSIGFMGMNNERSWETDIYSYDWESDTVGDRIGEQAKEGKDGGQLYGITYNGYLADNFSVSATAGRVAESYETIRVTNNPSVWDERNGGFVTLSEHVDATIYDEEYIRDQARVDFSWDLESHTISFGADYTNLQVKYDEEPNGADAASSGWFKTYTSSNSGNDYIEQRIRIRHTDSEVKAMALYVNDSWQVTDSLVLNAGLRATKTENTLNDGSKYVDFDFVDQLAPRLQAIYDVSGDGSSKVFATYGRYFQPVSANMNITQAGETTDIRSYYPLNELDANGHPLLLADGTPSRGEMLGDPWVAQNTIGLPAESIASTTLKPMYSDEFTLGYEQEVFETMSAGVRVTYRNLGRGVEDTDITAPLNRKLDELGYENVYGVWFLHNPGESLTIGQNFDGSADGSLESVTLTAEEMELDEMEREYWGLELTLDGNITEDLRINSSYVYSNSQGNTEGLVKTDNNQADPGWTTSYDSGDKMDNGYGDLPNSHEHVFKLNGSYNITESLIFGFVGSLYSGRPQSYYSFHPTDVDGCAADSVWSACAANDYGDHTSFYDENGDASPRGSEGNLPWVSQIDLSLTYIAEVFDNNLTLKATVYNVLNSDTATNINEQRTIGSEGDLSVNPNYGAVTERQAPVFASFVARYEF
ncbi:TonB-dependent receptor [Shewanella abyssi]|uniref:TonB-dependent receptor n=1 Tax=Shewanella abyssi TaxID=311789 RepID=UPI00200E70DA|nr:TonB-dependent receptor [Shewanella abyssi]MCL1050136.1 TonB-dependent receptor [Shewanella abyssi]